LLAIGSANAAAGACGSKKTFFPRAFSPIECSDALKQSANLISDMCLHCRTELLVDCGDPGI